MEPLKTSLVSEEQPSTEIDDRHYSLQAEQEDTQKRTFTSWVNSQLEKHPSPSFISDLYSDIGKGHVLLDLLEVLSGQQLPREKGSNTFQCRSNIENALTFLKNRSLKLINIHVADIIEGKPSIVLGLIWIIILHFHIEELAKALPCGYSHSSLDSPSPVDLSPAASPTARTNVKAKERWKISAKKAVLLWAKEQCDKHGSISVADFKSSWRNGLAFLAIIHALRPGLVDVEKAKERSNKENLREAFQIAEKELSIPRLLEPEDVDVTSPDEKSIMTYVAQFLQYFKSLPVAEDRMQGKIKETLSWLSAQECKLTKLLTELENASFYRKFEAMLSFTEAFNEEKKAFIPILESKRKGSELNEDYLEMKEAWDNLSYQMTEWKAKLNNMLPPSLEATEAWLKETEQHLAHNRPISQDHVKATAALEEKLRAVQNLMESFQSHLETFQSFDNRDNAGMLVVPPQKLEEMRKRFSKVQLENFSIIAEYYCSSSSAVFNELTSKLNIWNIKFGTKETVELLLLDWHNFIEEKSFLGQLDTALQICEAQKNKMLKALNLEIDPEETVKLFKMTEVQISKCREYINNVNDTLKKNLSSWTIYTENIQLLKSWLEETRKDHLKKISPEILAAWNSRHGSLNEAGNFLIESSNAEVGSAVSGELKKLNRKWAKLIKKTKFEMKLLVTDNNGNVETSRKFNPDVFNNPVQPSKELPKMCSEKAEIAPISLQTDPCTPDEFFSEDEDKLNFEKAYKELETIVLQAMHLVGQKTISEEPHSKYEEAFSILDTNILSKFLKAAEQLKSILSAHEKALVEERSKDVCERWEAARCEIMSYIHLKLKIEREKFNKTFSNLNKQINKEKKLLNAGKTKGLIEEHEAFFSQQGSLGELNTCLQALKTMSDKITKVEKESKIKLPIAEYEQKKKELQQCAATIYNELVSRTGDDHSPEKGEFTPASVNEEKVSSQNPEAEKDSEDVSCINLEPEKEFQNGKHHAEKLESGGDLALKKLKESYDTARHNLKLHLKSIRETITPSLTDDVRNISSLQKKLQILEALDRKGDSSWKLFDSVASQLVKFSCEMDLEDLHKEWDELQFALDKRMESLKAALAHVMPIENEWVLLCRSEEQLCKRDIPRYVMSKTDLLYKKVKKIQASILNCIEQCNSQEQKSPAGWTIDQRDRQAIGLIISEYKIRLEEMSQKIQAIETVLQDFESFLASLRHIQCSMDASASLSSSPQSMQEVSHMEKEAKTLDEKLKQLHIYFVEAESGEKKMSCEELVAALLVKENPCIDSEATQNQKTEEFSLRNNELFKNLQDIYDSISVIGLRDPTIPAISQRLKLLDELWKKLDRCAPEMKALNEISQFSQLPKAQDNEASQQWRFTQDLWKKTKLAITEKREYCKSTMELLKQYQICKTCLTSIILKQENALSQQASYMGKENLQKIIAKVNMAKEEFNSYSEDVDRLNQMCKNLQSQVNKMKSFEEPPFENEANAIVDRWLDINERTESYCENLERALALWDKLLNTSSLIDEWSDAVQKTLDDGNVTEKELEELEADVLFQEKKLEEFDTQVDEIQDLLNGSEPPLELQVIKSSLLNKMELIRKHLPNKSEPTEVNGSTTKLKGDLDLAKTQIGMTESLLEALSPSDPLEIFTKLEEIHQKILHQKQHVKLLQKGTGYLNPDVIELKKLLTSITDLFNSKKQTFQDYFTTLLNHQCKHFDDWFSNLQICLEECFDSPETKEMAEKKIHQLMSFLHIEDKGNDIDEVKTVLNQVKNYLPKANVYQLSNWVRDQEVELQRVISKCQARKIELHYFLQQFARLEKDFKSLQKWLRTQEEKWQQVQKEKTELEHFYQILLKQREWFDSFDCRANYLKNSGFFNDEAVLKPAQFVCKYKRLVNHVQKILGVSEMYCIERKHFEELVRNMFCWVEILKKPVLEMSAEESEISLEERLLKIKEIALLKEEGNAKLQTIIFVGEHLKCDDKSKNLAIEQIVSDVQKKWDSTIHLVIGCLKDQEQLQHQMEHVKQTEDAIKALFYEVEKQKQGLNVDIHPNSQQGQSQLNNYSALLKEIEGLMFLLNELTRQRNSLETCTNSFSAESLMALQHLYQCLLSRLQNTTKLLEGSVEGHQQCEELTTLLITSLEDLWEPVGAEQNQVQYDILCQVEDRLQEVVALMDSISLEQTCMKDEIDAPQIKLKHLKIKYGLEHETEDIHSDILKHKKEMDNETTNREKLENSFRVKNQLDREAPELFPEWLIHKVQLPSCLALVSEERAAAVTGELKGNLMEAHNFQSSASECAKQRQKSEQILADDYPNESPQQQHGYQKKLQATCAWSEMPQTILPLMNGKVMEADPTPLSIIHPSPESKQGYLEDQTIAECAELEKKINEVKMWTAELDIVLMKDQLREIEDLCLQLGKKKAQALSVWPEHTTVAEGSQPKHQGAHSVISSSWDRLLQELMAAKEAKQNQFNLVNRYHKCLATVQSSMKHLLAEKENIYTRGPVEDTVLLENLNKLLASLQKENSLLDKLRIEQENLSRHLSTLDRELVQSQVNQAEQWWKQMGDCLQKKQCCVAAEVDEFKLFMDKAQELQRCLQQQHDLQTGLSAPGTEEHPCPISIPLELRILKRNISLLKRNAEVQMKRMWSNPGKTALENTINYLQSQVEELEQMTPKENVQITDSHSRTCEIRKEIEDAILGNKILMHHLDERAALFPDDLLSQIKCCKAVISDAKEKEPTFIRLADEAQHVASHMPSKEDSALSILSHELQTGYQFLILKSSQKLQQLESQLGKRDKLFANIEKFEAQLQKIMAASSLDIDKANIKSEFDHMQNLLQKTPKKIQEMEALLDANCNDSSEGLNAFEQLFLNDCLKCLRNRAKRVHRVIQIKGCLVEHKMGAYKKFSEEIKALQQDLSNLHFDELELSSEELLSKSQVIKDKVNMFKDRTLAIESRLSYLDQYQEIWKWLDPKWDTLPLDELKDQFCKAKDNLDKRGKCLKNLFAEYDRHQIVLSEIEAIISSIQKECGDLKDLTSSPEASLISGKKLMWRVEHAKYITQEAFKLFKKNKSFSASLKKANIKQIKSLDAKIDGLEQMICSMIVANQEIFKYKQGFQSKLGHSLRTLKQIQSELQQPVLLDLKIQMIPYEMMYCKVLKGAIEAEIRAAEDIIKEKSSTKQTCLHSESLDKEIEEFQNLKIQLKADFAKHTEALDEAFKMVKLYNKAVEKSADLLHQCEAFLSTPLLDLPKLEESHLDFAKNQEESEFAMAEVEALTCSLKKSIKSKARLQVEKVLDDLTARNLRIKEQSQNRNSYIQRYMEKYHSFRNSKERICVELNNAEKVLWKYYIPVSYKESLEHSEQNKMLLSQLLSTKEELMNLRRDAQFLSFMCKENDGVLIVPIVSMLWLKWLYLFNIAKEREGKCEEQNQEWKSVSEELEREAIILDSLQEELPESIQDKQQATKEELEEFLESVSNYIENVDTEKLLLHLILCRLRNILSVPGSLSGKESLPIVCEIQNMQQRTEELCQKAQTEKEAVQSEMVYRTKCSEELKAMKTSFQGIISQLCDIDLETPNEKALKLEEIQRVVDSKKQILDNLQIKFTEIYRIVPVGIEEHLEDCKGMLHDVEEKVSTEFLKNSPHYSTEKKIEDINKGLQAVKNMLHQKSENISKAKEVQKRIWDLLDLWHYKMNELDSEVQDIVEQDPHQAQELMDRWMIPLQQYQHVSQHAERRTTDLNRAASKLEECDELLKSIQVWLESTNRLLTEEVKSDSAKALNKHVSALEMALEDSEQKQSILGAISPELKELSPLIETDSMVQELTEVNEQVKALQQKIMEILPCIQDLADDVEAIESEVKTMEKDIEKMKTILSPSEDTLDFSPKEHLTHCKVILAHICPMKTALAEMQSYKAKLRSTDMRMQPLSVFQRTKQLLKELKVLERLTEKQNTLLEPIVKEMEEFEQQIDFLKQSQFPKSNLDELSTENLWPVQDPAFFKDEEVERVKQQIALLCQQKEDILTAMKNALVELHQNQEPPEAEDSDLESPEENGSAVELQPKKRSSLAFLPSLVEEAEDSSFHNEEVDTDTTKTMSSEDSLDIPTKGKSSTQLTNLPECLWRSLSNTKATKDTVKSDSEPAQVLHVCQAQIAELELWLDQVKESVGSEAQICQMQQSVEQHLAACQVMLTEIEQKVMWLLEECKGMSTTNSSGLEQETENLSLNLKNVKCKLVKVQRMLQEKHTEEQLLHLDSSTSFPNGTSERALFIRPNGFQHKQELLLKLSEQDNLIDFLEVYMEKIQPQPTPNTVLDLQTSNEAVNSGNEPLGLTPKDQTGDKWQYLQEELLLKKNAPHCQLDELQISTKINILPLGATSSVRTPTIEELKTYTAQLDNLSQEASTQENETRENALSLDGKLFELFLAISRCLNNMEQMLGTCVLSSEEAPVQQVLYETLSAELQKLHTDIGDKKDDLLKSITSAGGNSERFSQCLSNLQAWLQLTQTAAASRSESMKTEMGHYISYQNEIRHLYDALIEKKSSLQQFFSEMSGHNISKQFQLMDVFESELQNFETQAAKLRDHGERVHLPVAVTHDVNKLEEVLDDLWEFLRVKQKELSSSFIKEQQCETLLQGFAELIDLGEKKLVSKLKITSRSDLDLHLQNHKSFFCKLNGHMLLVQKVAASILQNREKYWKDMVEKSKSLEEQAIQQGTHLEKVLQDWMAFDENYVSFFQKLEAISPTVPFVALVEETEERVMERTQLLQEIQKNLEGEQARYYEIVKEGKNLTELLSCPEVQSKIEKLESQWASFSQRVDHELQRLETLHKLLSSYNKDSKELNVWLESAQQNVNYWKEQSLNASQDQNTVRNHIQSLLEFSKEVDDKSSLKSSVISTGNQLLLIKESDDAKLRSALAEYEQRWTDLVVQLPGIQEKFHQLQMAKLPSYEAITELNAWMNCIDQQRRDEVVIDLQSSASLKDLLRRYKEYVMEMNFKQWIVDYVNQSLLQLTPCDVESKRYERTSFAECLGELNMNWHQLQGTLNEKIKELEHILESVVKNENKAQSLGSWLEAQSRRLKHLKSPASSILAQGTLKDCKVLENQLAVKSKEVDQLKNCFTASKDCADTAKKVGFTTTDLAEMRSSVINQVAQLKSSTESALEYWKTYDEVWDEIRLMLANAVYFLEHSKNPFITMKSLKKQVEDLQSLQDKAEGNKEIWARLQTAVDNLKKVCDPSFSEIIEQKHEEARTRWLLTNKNIEEKLQKAHAHLHLWEFYTEVSAKLDKYEEQYDSQLMPDTLSSCTMDFLKEKAENIKRLQFGLQDIKEYYLQASESGDTSITQLAEPETQNLLQEKPQPLQRISYLEKMLQMKADVHQYGLSQLENFGNSLEKLENHVKISTEILENSCENSKNLELLMSQLLSLASLSPEMERLNEISFRLPLCDFTVKRLQNLNRQWTQKTALVLEQCSELQKHQSDDKKFLQQCQNWVQFLEKMKETLKQNMPGTLEKLQEQQKEYEVLQTEISINQQIFSCLVSKALNRLESGEAESRTEFISRLTLLKEQWQSVVRMAHRKKRDIDSLVKQWQKFTTLLQDLTKFLMDTNSYIAAVKSQEKYRLDQIRNLNHKFKNKEILQKRWQTRYSLILDTGEKLLGTVAPEAKAAMQLEINKLRANWDNTQLQLEKITRQFQGTIQTWENCERQVKDLGHVLVELKGSINKPLPIEHDALPATLEQVKVLEKSLTNWSQNAKELDAQKVKVAQFILPEDVMVLREQIERLHSQWKELCLRVSLHKQDIEEQLNAWIVFNEKNKELCTWLMQMEEKVPQSADISIEDMIEKLQKDYMEEINLFNESELVHFKQMGNQLIKSSNQSRGAEIEEKLNKINDRWQHLFDIIGGRVKKLKDTFAFIQQLDKNMSHLHTWLARIESELSKPIVYDICDDQEIQRRLSEQQDLQRDIEQHTAGVESVFNICEILLHDSDACANETECDSIQQTTRSLERRWRNICAMSIERRMKIEATWRLWQKFLEDYSRFEVWLKAAEKTAAYPNSSEILYVTAKEELKKFEAFQRQIHERLTQLELINKQYRRLARENRTDSANKLKQMVYEGNHRWDNLQKRVTAILRRLKHFTNQWEEFMGTKDNIILVWLTEMDLQLTNVEHFSKSDFDDKMRQLNGFQREITLNTSKIEQLTASGLKLIQKSEPEDAIILEEELEEFRSYCQEVFGRVARFHQRLTSWHPGLEDEKESSENEADSDHARGMQTDPWPKKTVQEGPPSQQSLCHLIPSLGGPERSGCETPVSVDSIPLEWDHTGDVGGSSSPEEEEEDSFFSALSDVEITEHPEAYLKMTTKALKAASGKSAETHIWHPSEHPVCRKHSYNQEEMVRSVLSNNEDSSTSYKPGNVKALSTRSMDDIKDISGILPSKDSQENQNFISVSAIEKQPVTIERWELLQVQDLSNKLRMKQTWQQWQQLNSDLTNIDIWLDKMEEEMEGLQEEEPQPVNSIQAIEQRVKKLKDMVKAYNNYKALVLSVNLTSKDFKQTDSTGCKELQNRLRRVNLRWEKANISLENWKKNLQKALIHCQDFHEQNQKLLLWLAAAETRRHQAQVKEPNADPHRIQESRKELMQLEKELLERQLQVNSLQEIAAYLLVKPDGEKYIEANEKVHVIGKKLKQLLEGVSCDLKVSQGRQDVNTFQVNGEELDSGTYQLSEKSPVSKNKVDEKEILQSNTRSNVRMEEKEETNSFAPKKSAFFCRVLRAAFPLQLFLLLLLFLASLIPVSEEDYSCTQTNNFARSFYPMLRYINGPPPT